MDYRIDIETATAELIAAMRVKVPIAGVAQAWKPALDQVWVFLKENPGLRPGHNLFLYHHPARRSDPMEVDFGVQVAQRFAAQGAVRCAETPAGEVATTVHVGPYEGLRHAHDALRAWCAANDRLIAQASWEIYGDWQSDPARLETTIKYLLA
jgi:effector-binding domain-containing protein